MVSIEVGGELRIAQVGVEAAEEIFALTEANREHLRRWLPWLDEIREVSDTARFLATCSNEASAGTGLYCGIFERDVIVGVCAYNHIDQRNRSARIGYWLAENLQGGGVMSRCIAALVDYGFSQRALHRQVISCAEGNRASAAVAERCGFQCEGGARDAEWLYDRFVSHLIYARVVSAPDISLTTS